MNALYNRYRPGTFAYVLGQDGVQAVANAVRNGEPHHAYLFVGPRGTGKTSVARLVAMGLNCDQGPTAVPCGVCQSCQSIKDGSAMDVREIDAASGAGVDGVRELTQSMHVVPAFGRYRVFIIDEVQAFAKQAWQAFLKTLEEPSPQTVFILCTTDAHKVPPTVQSRVSRIDFRLQPAEVIAECVLGIAVREGATQVDEDAALMIGRAARGSFRDGIQILDDLLRGADLGPASLTREMVAERIGQSDEALTFKVLGSVAGHDVPGTLEACAYLLASCEPADALDGLERLAREVMICSSLGGIPTSMQTTPAHDSLIGALTKTLGAPGAARLLEEVGVALQRIAAGADPRVRLELALLKCADPQLAPTNVESLAARLDRVEGIATGQNGTGRPT